MVTDPAIFRIDGHECHWQDLLAWAEFLGLADELRAQCAWRRACLDYLTDSGLITGDEELQDALREWRYRHHLLTGRDVEHWLAERQLNLGDLETWLRGQLAPARVPQGRWPALARRGSAEAAGLWCAVNFGGGLRQWCDRVLIRLTAVRLNGNRPGDGDAVRTAREALARRRRLRPAELGAWVADCLVLGDRLDPCLHCEASFRDYIRDFALDTPPRLESQERSHLLRLRFTTMHARTLDIAREARLCLDVDGEDPDALATRTGLRCRHRDTLADDLRPDLRRLLLSAVPGQCLPPERHADGHTWLIHRIEAKTPPDLDETEVFERWLELRARDSLRRHANPRLEWCIQMTEEPTTNESREAP